MRIFREFSKNFLACSDEGIGRGLHVVNEVLDRHGFGRWFDQIRQIRHGLCCVVCCVGCTTEKKTKD